MFEVAAREALSNLFTAKLRTFLAVLGVLVGTASVVAMVSCGELVTREALKQFERLGTDIMSVSLNAQDDAQRSLLKRFNTVQAQQMKLYVPAVTRVAPYTSNYTSAHYEGHSINAAIIGVTQSMREAIKINVKSGRFISDLDKYNQYAFIGFKLYKNLLTIVGANPIGRQIQLNHSIFTIIGVAKPWPVNNFFYQDVNNAILIPIKSSRLLSKYTVIDNVLVNIKKGTNIKTVQSQIKSYLTKILPGISQFFKSAEEIIKTMQKQSRLFTIFLGLIGSISLLVGGIGVMNIMLVSVVERRREIGIRKALGATPRDIASLFLVESATLSLFGGVLGVLIGILTSYIIAHQAGWEFTIFIMPAVVGFTVSEAVGIFFGFYPAYLASKLDPIETLRSE